MLWGSGSPTLSIQQLHLRPEKNRLQLSWLQFVTTTKDSPCTVLHMAHLSPPCKSLLASPFLREVSGEHIIQNRLPDTSQIIIIIFPDGTYCHLSCHIFYVSVSHLSLIEYELPWGRDFFCVSLTTVSIVSRMAYGT